MHCLALFHQLMKQITVLLTSHLFILQHICVHSSANTVAVPGLHFVLMQVQTLLYSVTPL